MEIIKKIKNLKPGALFSKKKRETPEVFLYAATSENVHKFQAGMFWYDDNTFSYEMIVNKSLRAVVIKVKRGKVIGLLPMERTFNVEEAAAFEEKMPKVLEESFYLKCIRKMPRLSDWRTMYLRREAISHSLSDAGWLPLSGAYWCWDGFFRCKPAAVYNLETAEKSQTANASAKGRYLIELTIK